MSNYTRIIKAAAERDAKASISPDTVIAFQEQENASLRRLVSLLTKGYKDSVERQRVIAALVEHEMLYGELK